MTAAALDRFRGRCAIHPVSPFGCAFFSCGPEVPGLAYQGLASVMEAGPHSLYGRTWRHLHARGLVQQKAETLRRRMRDTLENLHGENTLG